MRLLEYFEKRHQNLTYFFKLIDQASDLKNCFIQADLFTAVVAFSDCNISKQKVTLGIIFHYNTEFNKLETKYFNKELYNNAHIDMFTKFAIYLILNKRSNSFMDPFIKKIVQIYQSKYEILNTQHAVKNRSNLAYLLNRRTPQIKQINTFKTNIKLNINEVPIYTILSNIEKKRNDVAVVGALALHFFSDNDRYNHFLDYEIIPVNYDYTSKKVSAFLKQNITYPNFIDFNLFFYFRSCHNMYNSTHSTTSTIKKSLLDYVTDTIWDTFIHSDKDLRFIKINNSYYPFEYVEAQKAQIQFNPVNVKKNLWDFQINLIVDQNPIDKAQPVSSGLAGNHLIQIFKTGKKYYVAELKNSEIIDIIKKLKMLDLNCVQDILFFTETYKSLPEGLTILDMKDKQNVLVSDPLPCLYVRKEHSNYLTIYPFLDYNPINFPEIDKNLLIDDFHLNEEYHQNFLTYLNEDIYLKADYSYYGNPIPKAFDPKYVFLLKIRYLLQADELEDWFKTSVSEYIEHGISVYTEYDRQVYQKQNFKLVIQTNQSQNWLEFKPLLIDLNTQNEIEIDTIDFENLVVTDKKKTIFQLSQNDWDKLKNLMQMSQKSKEKFRVPSDNPFILRQLDQMILPQSATELSQKIEKNLSSFDKIKEYPLPKKFKGELRNYQKAGYNWLRFLNEFSFHGCLADDMGLGKTVQTLALLQGLKEKKNSGVNLLVVPLSSIPNWLDEMERFTPQLTCLVMYGNLTPDHELFKKYDIILSSYATARQRTDQLKDFPFNYIILDESQNIKNYSTLTAKAIKTLQAEHRLALSGTPIENNLSELWSLFDFLQPGYFGNIEYFKEKFINPIQKDKDQNLIDILKKSIYPFILRRRKQDVEIDLPEKNEITIHVDMNEDLEKVYLKTSEYYQNYLKNVFETEGMQKSATKVFEALLRLRQLCLFPSLADKTLQHIESPKFAFLTETLDDILQEDHKILIFSQFTSVLDIIQKYLKEKSYHYCRIDGSSNLKQREIAVKDFQENAQIPVFLLSLKSGGVALNLTAADYVVIFDPWWNPAVEAQAVDRAHRIGQTKKVICYRIVVKNSIEDKIMKLKEQKKELVDSLISEDASLFKKLSKEELLNLFSF